MRGRRLAIRSGALVTAIAFAFVGEPHVAAAGQTATSLKADSSTATTASSVILSGEGASDPSAELTGWQNDLYGTNGDLTLNYIASGGFKARQDLISGAIDYAISGVPFTPDELAQLPKSTGSLIAAPVMASALAVLVLPPAYNNAPNAHGWGIQNLTDANANGEQRPTTFVPYTGTINVPNQNLAAMLLGSNVPGTLQSNWDNDSVVGAFGLTNQVQDYADGYPKSEFEPADIDNIPASYLRSEGSESDYYAQLFASEANPSLWAYLQSSLDIGAITDNLPPALVGVHTTQGLDNILNVMNPTGLPAVNGTNGGGIIAAVSPSGLTQLKAVAAASTPNRPTTVQWIAPQNAAGEYVTPSPTSIDAAVNAGGDTPFYALTHSVSGAYPLTYIDDLYAPAHGLSVDKTEAIATTIRYLATDGQNSMAASGDGALPTSLVSQALAAANQLVLSNCPGAGGEIDVSTDPGRLAPSLPGLKGIGSMLHCDPAPAAASKPIASATGGVASTLSNPDLSTVGTDSASGYQSPVSTTTSATSASGANGTPAAASSPSGTKPQGGHPRTSGAITLAGLPLTLPGSASASFDRLTALLLGAGLFFLGRRVVSWLARLVRG